MTGQTRRKPSVPAPAPQRTAATHASGAHEFSYRMLARAAAVLDVDRGDVRLLEGLHGAPQVRRVVEVAFGVRDHGQLDRVDKGARLRGEIVEQQQAFGRAAAKSASNACNRPQPGEE